MDDNIADPFPKLGSVYKGTGSKFNQNNRNVAPTKLNSPSSASRPWGSQTCNSNAWGNPNVVQKLTEWGNGGSGVGQGTNNNHLRNKFPPQSVTSPTPHKGLYSSVVAYTTPSKDHKDGQCKNQGMQESYCENNDGDDEIVDSDSDVAFHSDDDVLSLDDTDSDNGERSHESCKKSKWLRDFFDHLEKVKVEEMNSLAKRWHCPACRGGPGAIDWYHGLQAILNHARTIQVRRVKLHRMFAETLEEECFRRRAPLTMSGEAFGLWVGLDKTVKDHQIIWPPMVIIINTRYEQDESNKWTGMGNQELLDCFSDYAALKARHSYGPQGHRGMSVLIFDATTAGYLESLRLHKHFKEQGRDREAWDLCQNPFAPGGKRQLYGYLASREDLDIFNRHSGGKSKLKFEMRSYQEMVESKIRNINDDRQLLDYFKNAIAKEKLKSEAFANSLSKVSDKLRKTTEENRVVRERTKEHQQQNKEEMDAQETFFLDQIQIIHETIVAKEDQFEKLQQAKRDMELASSEKENGNHMMKNVSSFIMSQDKDMRQFEAERDDIIKCHEEKKLALKKKQWVEQVELEKELENELTQLMSKYSSLS